MVDDDDEKLLKTPDPETLRRVREAEARLEKETKEQAAYCPLCKTVFPNYRVASLHRCPILNRRRFRWWDPRTWRRSK